MNGYLAAAIAVLIWASYPVATRAGVTGSFVPQDLVLLRFGIGALLFLPYVMLQWRRIARAAWLQGIPLTLFQGAGMGALAICGMQLAPANHAAALGPGANAAWVALLGLLLFAKRPSPRAIVGSALTVAGIALIALWSAAELSASVLVGDAMFLAASALGALYVLQLRNWGINPMQGAAIVSLYSALLVVPYYLWSGPGGLREAHLGELLWQILWQGLLIGCVALVALNYAISRLGSERSSALVALVPVLTAFLAMVFLGEKPSAVEVAAFVAISFGVSIAAAPARRPRAIRPFPALRQNAPHADYPARDSAP